MAELDDLKAAVDTLTTAVSDTSTELKAVADALVALKNAGSIDPAQVEAAAQQISTLAGNLESAVSGAKTETGV